MKRRAVLQILSKAGMLSLLPPLPLRRTRNAQADSKEVIGRLFFEPGDRERILRSVEVPYLRSYYQSCLQDDVAAQEAMLQTLPATRDLIRDLPKLHDVLHRAGLVYLVTGDAARRSLLLKGLETLMQFRDWDYFLEGGREVIGLQRAPGSVIAALWAMQVLDEALPAALRERVLSQIAEKGCMPCYRSVWGMRYKEKVKGWGFNPRYEANFDIDFRRWPWILDETNLKAVPVAGLGLGALVLQETDSRAEEWLEMAEWGARTWLQLLKPDGSYHEGISYLDYSLRNLFLFFDAHMRLKGTIDWVDLANFYGIAEYYVCMQNGRRVYEGEIIPDIVNFSDARFSFFPTTALWLSYRLSDPLARYAAEHFSGPRQFTDYLYYDPEKPSAPPSPRLLNRHIDLDWIVCRSGWEPHDAVLAFRSGAPSNHEHADRNTFIYKVYGERLLDDHFGASYDRRDPGWLLRQTEAHNGVLIDGRGHQYHDGREGTNASQASARVLRFVDRGDIVWWTSDATQAYQLVESDVETVLRTVVFIKPDIVVLFDRLVKKTKSSTFAARFHPDNHDGEARVRRTGDTAFRIERPGAVLFGQVAGTLPVETTVGALNLPESRGRFPFVQIQSGPAQRSDLVTLLVARPRALAGAEPVMQLQARDGDWHIQVDGRTIRIHTAGPLPEIEVL